MILDYSKTTTPIQEAYAAMNRPKEYEIVTEGGLGIFLGGLTGFLVGGPIGAIAGAYVGHRAQEMGVKQFMKNVLGIGGGIIIGSLGGPLGALAGGIGGYRIAKESIEEQVVEAEQKIPAATQFKELFHELDLFLKDKSLTALKKAVVAVKKINKDSIVNKLDKDMQNRLVKIYVFLMALNELATKNDKESKSKFEKILSTSAKDVAATAANMIAKKK